MTETLRQIADLVRSKNAGPFWLTIDVFLGNHDDYLRVAGSSLTDPKTIATRYHVDAESVRIFTLPALNIVKISLPRPVVQGALADRDMHGGQQYIALLDLPIESAGNFGILG
jgi:hypothetical protein